MEDFNEKYVKRNPFTVPSGYFEALEGKIMNGIKREKKVTVFQMLKPYWGLVGVFVFAFVMIHKVLPRFAKDKEILMEQKGHFVDAVENDFLFDADFNPTKEELVEYLAQEVNIAEFLFEEMK